MLLGGLLKGVMRYTVKQTLCGLLGHIVLAAFNESSMTVSQMTLCFMSGSAATLLPVGVVQGFLSVCYVRISSFNVTAAPAWRSNDPCPAVVMLRDEGSKENPLSAAINAGVSNNELPEAAVVSAVTADPRLQDLREPEPAVLIYGPNNSML